MFVTLLIVIQLTIGAGILNTFEPRENLWVTWANQTGTSSFCLALASATDPLRTCLIGIPGFNNSAFAQFSINNCAHAANNSHCTALLLSGLNVSLPWDPQEIDLLGCRALNGSGSGCIYFGNYKAKAKNTPYWLTPTRDAFTGPALCGNSSNRNDPYGWGNGQFHIWANNSHLALPPKVFLICGDRAWHGIPKHAHGGPCYLGQLTLLALNRSTLIAMKNLTRRSKRDISSLSPDCNDHVELWDKTARVFASLISGIGTAQALTTIGKLACWVAKQSTVTTQILEQLSQDVNSLRHAILQNRAATDFLLLAHGHGCKDFEGMCCFNLSDHSESIHKQLQWLKEHTNQIQQSQGWFDNLLTSMFGVLPLWLKGLLAEGLRFLVIIVLIGLCICVAFQCFKKGLEKAVSQAWIVQKEKGGIVGNWLAEKGHVDMLQLAQQKYRLG